jgi:phytoene dehydrogenase-like protein
MSKGEVGMARHYRVAVVGGGIAGLYCARELARRDVDEIIVLERLREFGGRIETGDLRGFVGDASTTTRPVFKAEFGPMRFEPKLQPLFDQLRKELGVTFGPFTPPSSPKSPIEYPLSSDECESDGVTPLRDLELLKLGIYRMFGKKTNTIHTDDSDKIVLDDEGQAWLDALSDGLPQDDPHGFEYLRMSATSVKSAQPLWQMGFWNALLEVLSPFAVSKVQKEGTFYHLIPTNPNAVEWAIFWLRLFKLGNEPLSTIPAGVRTVVERLQSDLEAQWKHHAQLSANRHVTSIKVSESKPEVIQVEFVDNSTNPPRLSEITADHVVLALPRQPLKALSAGFPAEVRSALDDVEGFTLLKVFACGRPPAWWPKDEPPAAQDRAWLMPTREVHYFRDVATNNALTLLYMDEPSSRFWGLYVQAPMNHERAEYGGNFELKRQLVRLVLGQQRDVASSLVSRPARPKEAFVDPTDPATVALLRLIEELGLAETFKELEGTQLDSYSRLPKSAKELLRAPSQVAPTIFGDVSDYAIRDWSKEPFGAGCHTWRPGARSWEVRSLLRGFGMVANSQLENVHICGEAYSDYQGFIEGALRSAADAVASITGETANYSAVVVKK